MKPKLLGIFFCVFFVQIISAQNSGNCNIEDITEWPVYLDEINDTDVSVTFFESPYTGTVYIISCSNDTYYKPEVETDLSVFKITTTDSMATFDYNTPKQTNNYLWVTSQCQFDCGGTQDSVLTIQVTVNDINSHPPTFAQSEYEYKVAVPLMPSIDFTTYGDEIVVTDLDFSNQNVIFTIEPDHFIITTSASDNSKDYKAVFSTRNTLNFNQSMTYTITATDSGTNPTSLNSTATITLTPNEDTSLDTPSFGRLIYSFNYSSNPENNILTPNDGEISFSTNKISTAVLSLEGEFASYFNAKMENDSYTITLSVNESLPTTNALFTIFALELTTDNKALTSIVVYLPQTQESNDLEFTSPFYVGSYSTDTNNVTLSDGPITLASSGTPTLKLSGDYYGYFKIQYDDTTNECSLTNTELPTAVIRSHDLISLTITATLDGSEEKAGVVITLPDYQLKFTNVLYRSFYKNDNVTLIDTISLTDDDVNISVYGSYNKSFAVTIEDGKWVVKVNTPLSNETLQSNTYLLVTLTAEDSYKNTATAVLEITLPTTTLEIEAPIFSEPLYNAEYKITESGAIVVFIDKLVIINMEKLGYNVTISVEEYTEYFSITYNSEDDDWAMNVTSPLLESILLTQTKLVFTLLATDTTNNMSSQSAIAINLPSVNAAEAPLFSQTYYTGKYSISGDESAVALEIPIEITNRDNYAEISISVEPYTDNFNIAYDSATGEWKVNVIENLDQSVLNAQLDIVMSLIAIDQSNDSLVGKSALILALPVVNSDQAPSFSSIYYQGSYNTSDDNFIFEQAITITNKNDLSNITITLDGEYREYFISSFNEANSSWTVNLVSSLDDFIVENNKELILTLTASEVDNENIGQSTLIVSLISEKIQVAPKFSSSYYTANYTVDGDIVNVSGDISITNKEADNVTVVVTSYTSNFNITFDSANNRWNLNVKIRLEDNILKEYSQIIITLQATEAYNENTGESIIILNLPEIETEPEVFKFSQVSYTVLYIVSSGVPNIESNETIQISSNINISNVNVGLQESEYSSYFSLNQQSGIYTVNVDNPLPPEILNRQTSLVLTLVATLDTKETFATLVINLPVRTSESSSISFKSVLYKGQYEIVEDRGVLTVDAIRVETTEPDENVKCSVISESYSKYFECFYSNEALQVTLTEDLPDITENSYISLTLTVNVLGTTDVSSAVLNVDLVNNNSNNGDDNVDVTPYIVAISILSVLFVCCLGAAVAYYFIKIRNKNNGLLEEEKPKVRFNKKSLNRPNSSNSSTLETRRPTGFISNTVALDEGDIYDNDINKNNGSLTLKKRSSTEFVSNGIEIKEEDIDDFTKNTNGIDKVRKKSVAFDDKVEKMHIDPIKDEDNASAKSDSDQSLA